MLEHFSIEIRKIKIWDFKSKSLKSLLVYPKYGDYLSQSVETTPAQTKSNRQKLEDKYWLC